MPGFSVCHPGGVHSTRNRVSGGHFFRQVRNQKSDWKPLDQKITAGEWISYATNAVLRIPCVIFFTSLVYSYQSI